MRFVGRLIQALLASGAVREDAPIDPAGTLAVLPMTPAVFTTGAWVTLPAGEVTIEYQVNTRPKGSPGGYGIRFSIPFSLTLQTPGGQPIEIRRPRDPAYFASDLGNAFVRTTYGTAELPGDGGYAIRASGKTHRRGKPHLRFL